MLAARETPLSAIHLRNVYELALIPGETHHFDKQQDRMRSVIREWLERIQN